MVYGDRHAQDSSASTGPSEAVSPRSVANDRWRQLAAAAWILGWLGGPIPALVMLLVTGDLGWARRHIASAAGFWTVMWGILFTLLGVAGNLDAFLVLWIAAVATALVVTMLGAYAALRASRASIARRQTS